MIYPDVTLAEWLRKYPDLKVITRECSRCGKEVSTTKAFVSADYTGLELEKCSHCGSRERALSYLVTSRKALREWSRFF